MNCEILYNQILSNYDSKFIENNFTTQCYQGAKESYIVLNNNKKKISVSVFFEESYEEDYKIYADFINVDKLLAWQIKTSLKKADTERLIEIIGIILKKKHFTRMEKKYLGNNMQPLYDGCNFEKFYKAKL